VARSGHAEIEIPRIDDENPAVDATVLEKQAASGLPVSTRRKRYKHDHAA
jgi:hypothetical protein